jgi:hypothetical protein
VMSTIFLVQILELVVERVPDHRRGTISGRLATSVYASQGIAILGGGVAAEQVGSFRAVALAGVLAVTVAALLAGTLWVARSRREPSGNEPKSSDTSHQRSLLAITGTSSPGPNCQPNPEVGGSGG